MPASRLNVKEQSAMDAQDEGMGDARGLREFALRRLLRELVEKAGRAETVEGLGEHQEVVGPAVHPALAAPGARAGGVVELADMAAVSAGAGRAAWWLTVTLEMSAASGQQALSKRSPAGRTRRLLNPFPATRAPAIINAVYGFSSLSRTKAGGSVPDPDRSPGIEPRSPRVGFNGDQRHPLRDADHGVEPRSSGVHVDAGHHPALAVGNRRTGRLHRKAVVQF